MEWRVMAFEANPRMADALHQIDDTTEKQKGWLAGNLHSAPHCTLDLARFFRGDTVSCPRHDQVYLKINVEGAEFPVVKHLMADVAWIYTGIHISWPSTSATCGRIALFQWCESTFIMCATIHNKFINGEFTRDFGDFVGVGGDLWLVH